MRALVLLLLLPLLPGQIDQPPSAAEQRAIVASLGSDRIREATWGAYRVATHRVMAAAPALRRLLRGDTFDASMPERAALTAAVLDALIRIDAPVEDAELLPHVDRFPRQTIILLGRDALRHADALRACHARSMGDVEWLAITNLLASVRATGLALDLIRDLELNLKVVVVDRADQQLRSSRCKYRLAYGAISVPEGFPPGVDYTLRVARFGLMRGGSLLARGPGDEQGYYDVFFERLESPGEMAGPGWVGDTIGRQHVRLGTLASLLGIPCKELDLQIRTTIHVVWSGGSAYLEEVARARAGIRAAFQEVVVRLRSAGLLEEGAARDLAPRLETDVSDWREDRGTPLPLPR